MEANWLDEEKRREAERERELEKKRVIYISSDLYPGGEFIPELDARITVFDRGFSIGDSAYEYARTYRHKPMQLREHMRRMFSSLKVMRLNPGVSEEKFVELCEELTKRNISLLEDFEEYNVVWEVTRGEWAGTAGEPPPPREPRGRPSS